MTDRNPLASGNNRTSGEISTTTAQRRAWIRDAFQSIAGRYDLLNTLLSGGVHFLWKRAAARAAALPAGGVAVDVCCGTGDLCFLMSRRLGPRGRIIGIDLAPEMLAVAQRRLRRGASDSAITLMCADAEVLPLDAASADVATFAFGLRNVDNPRRALHEVHRILRPGGHLVVLEFGRPSSWALRVLYDRYSRTIIPRVGGWLSGRRDVYQYLHDSIRQWLCPEDLVGIIRECGFQSVRYILLTGGIAVLHVAVKQIFPRRNG